MRKLTIRRSVVFFALLTLAAGRSAFTQNKAELTIRIDQIVSKDFPNMTVYAAVENEKGEVVAGLSPSLFSFRIDSLEETGKVTITPFALKELPIDYSIIFSNSGIMEGEPLDFQKNALLQFVESMKDNDRLSLYTVGEEASIVFEEQRKESIDSAVINAVEVTTVQPRLNDSIINVLRRVQRRQAERRVVIVISDGRDMNSRFNKDQLEAVLTEVGVPLYTIGMRVLNTQTLSALHEMAALTNGAYVYTPQLSTLPANLQSLRVRITQPYIITLRSRSLKADDMPHVFEVAVTERDAAGKGQRTFTAVRVPFPRWLRLAIIIAAAVVVIGIVVLVIVRRIIKRKRMGIAGRRCPDCGQRMKDSWDSCPFCRYLPNIKKKKKKKAEKKE
jgi:hypothetical protein